MSSTYVLSLTYFPTHNTTQVANISCSHDLPKETNILALSESALSINLCFHLSLSQTISIPLIRDFCTREATPQFVDVFMARTSFFTPPELGMIVLVVMTFWEINLVPTSGKGVTSPIGTTCANWTG